MGACNSICDQYLIQSNGAFFRMLCTYGHRTALTLLHDESDENKDINKSFYCYRIQCCSLVVSED
jgi:hypothetical protein